MKKLCYFIIFILFLFNVQTVTADIVNPYFTKEIRTFWIDKDGNQIPKPLDYLDYINQEEEKLDNDLLLVEENGKYGFKDKNDKWKIKPTFDYALDFSEDLAMACIKEGCGFIDKQGKWIIKPQFIMPICTYQVSTGEYKRNSYQECSTKPFLYSYFKEGLAPINILAENINNNRSQKIFKNGSNSNYSCGYINTSGEIVIKKEHLKRCGYFSEGLAPVSFSNRYNYIDKYGNRIINIPFYDVSSFKNGKAKVTTFISVPRKIKNVKIK